MDIQPMTLALARLALGQAIQNHLFDPNVSLIDFGYPEHDGRLYMDELAIRIHVRKKMSGAALETAIEAGATRRIPESYGGFQTDVPQTSLRLHQGWWWPRPAVAANSRARRRNPCVGGISISNQYQRSSGTLGGLVIDRGTGARMVLSNWHVLVGSWSARPGQKIYQPGRLDGGNSTDEIARLSRDAMGSNLDAAVAILNGERPLIDDQYELGPVTGVQSPVLGIRVVKSGRRTAITYGMVTAIEGVARLRYDSLNRVIHRVLTIEPQNTFEQVSGPGDSGSIWLEEGSHKAIGLHFAGSDYPERALAMEMQPVLEALQVELVSTIERTTVFTPAPQVELVTV